jgi:4TM region of DNA translocase FtsK/SpoIIIE
LKLDISPAEEDRTDWLPLVAFGLAALFGVVVFLPPEGSIGVPLHDALAELLGRAMFVLPVALLVTGVLLLIRAMRRGVKLPHRQLVGVGLIAFAVLPAEHLLGNGRDGTGRIGQWLSAFLLDLLGSAGTTALLVGVLGVGVALAFDIRLPRAARANDAAG